jgi:hypothetical protein
MAPSKRRRQYRVSSDVRPNFEEPIYEMKRVQERLACRLDVGIFQVTTSLCVLIAEAAALASGRRMRLLAAESERALSIHSTHPEVIESERKVKSG